MKAYTERVFGNHEGKDVLAYRFETDSGYQLEIMTYGATILRYVTPDKAGNFANVILGFDDFDSYVGNSPKHGASVGPVAGRIAGATFELNGQTYNLEVNNASNCNHSGSTGWDSSLFELVEVSDHGLTLYTERTDGTGGFPGNLKIWISYHLEETGAYEVSYKVTTDQ
ncbi:aldose 1-epimerase, partial [Streptococcus sp. GMD1S]